ncbi:MAG: hypothetical protein ACYDHD_04755 [Vulcanimicrobiaceae bacterium]
MGRTEYEAQNESTSQGVVKIVLEQQIHPEEPTTADLPREGDRDGSLTRTLIWIGVAGLSAALAVTLVRVLVARPPSADPTSRRIQELIDEANQLLRTLDDQKHGA